MDARLEAPGDGVQPLVHTAGLQANTYITIKLQYIPSQGTDYRQIICHVS